MPLLSFWVIIMLIEKLIKDYLNYVKLFKSYGTYKFYDHHLNSILKFLNVNRTRKIKKKNLLEYISLMQEKGLSNKTINNRILSLKTMLKYAKLNNHIIFSIPKLKTKDVRYNNLSDIELKKLLFYIKTSNIKNTNKLIVCLLLETGIRLNELIHIKCKNIDVNNRSILLEVTKNNIDRIVFYSDLTNKYINKINLENEFLINLTHKGVYSIFERIRNKLNFNIFHPHMLRHTYATILVQNNTNLEFVRLTLGHKSLKTTQRYLHFNTEIMKKIYDNNFKY